jgi:hypothetical protein
MTTGVPGNGLIAQCLWLYRHPQFNELTLDHPMRMASVIAFLADELTPDEPSPTMGLDPPYENGWWACSQLIRKQLLREVAAVVDPILHPVTDSSQPAESMPHPCDPIVQEKRQEFLDWLWECSGRKEAGDHTYTGLYQEYLKAEAARTNPVPAN